MSARRYHHILFSVGEITDRRRIDTFIAEEIPEAANECPAVELRREQSPRKWRRADEPGEESDVRREVLYRRAAKMVELGKNRCSRVRGAP